MKLQYARLQRPWDQIYWTSFLNCSHIFSDPLVAAQFRDRWVSRKKRRRKNKQIFIAKCIFTPGDPQSIVFTKTNLYLFLHHL